MIKISFDELIRKFISSLKEVKSDQVQNELTSFSIKDIPLNIIELLKTIETFPKCYFSQKNDDIKVLGFGSAKYYLEPQSISNATVDLQTLESGVIMGGQGFFEDQYFQKNEWKELAGHYFFLPKLQFIKKKNKLDASIFYYNTPESISSFIDFLSNLKESFPKDCAEFETIKESSHFNLNFETAIEKAIQSINNHELEKVVLARKYSTPCRTENILPKVIKDWSQEVENHYQFLLQTSKDHVFISQTPERLFLINNKKIKIDAIAGTRPRGLDQASDEILAKKLLDNPKELEEHDFVVKSIKKSLEKYSNKVVKKKDKEILKLKNVQHLYSQYEATLEETPPVQQLLKELHPTPAVGGFPRINALNFIKEREDFSRGLYAAPIGIISEELTDFAVGIRSILISDNIAHIYAGCGIVADSIPNKEYRETQNKMENFMSLL